MEKFSAYCNALSHASARVVANATGFIVLAMFCSLFLQVVSRYCFNAPLSWPEEVTMFLMAWMSFLGASVALRNWEHIGVDFVLERIHGQRRTALLIVIRLVALIFALFLTVKGAVFVAESTNMVSDGLRISMVWPRLSMPVGGAFMILHLVALLSQDLLNFRAGRE